MPPSKAAACWSATRSSWKSRSRPSNKRHSSSVRYKRGGVPTAAARLLSEENFSLIFFVTRNGAAQRRRARFTQDDKATARCWRSSGVPTAAARLLSEENFSLIFFVTRNGAAQRR